METLDQLTERHIRERQQAEHRWKVIADWPEKPKQLINANKTDRGMYAIFDVPSITAAKNLIEKFHCKEPAKGIIYLRSGSDLVVDSECRLSERQREQVQARMAEYTVYTGGELPVVIFRMRGNIREKTAQQSVVFFWRDVRIEVRYTWLAEVPTIYRDANGQLHPARSGMIAKAHRIDSWTQATRYDYIFDALMDLEDL